jgi:F-type H+-transporting ATPase subunit b
MAAEHAVSGPGLHELYMLVNLLVVVGIFYVAGRRGIVLALRTRKEVFAKKLEESKRLLAEVQAASAKAKADLAEIDSLRRRYVSEARDEGKKIAEKLVTEAKQTADRIIADARLAAENETTVAMGRLQQTLVQEAIKQSLLDLDPSKAKNIHERYVTDFSQGAMANGKK